LEEGEEVMPTWTLLIRPLFLQEILGMVAVVRPRLILQLQLVLLAVQEVLMVVTVYTMEPM
jgi:hypothetical protein